MKRISFVIIIIAMVLSCSKNDRSKLPDNDGDYSLAMAILYNYYSSEYTALAYQAYNIASSKLDRIKDTAINISSYAVVVDIDETVLDNSPYQAKAIVDNFSYPVGWNEWCNKAIARPVPGSLEFLHYADSLGYKIFYLSNRKKEFVYEGTFDNLKKAGFPQVRDESLLLRLEKSGDNPDPSDKESRREHIRNMGYRIVLLVGDNLGDFYTDNMKRHDRNRKAKEASNNFGGEYIILPNAMYGNWPSAVGLDGSSEKVDSLLYEMSNIY